jgi:hypothetical protein
MTKLSYIIDQAIEKQEQRIRIEAIKTAAQMPSIEFFQTFMREWSEKNAKVVNGGLHDCRTVVVSRQHPSK